jgi:prepilin peptidase CpaA
VSAVSTMVLVGDGCLVTLLAMACISDLRTRRIPNGLVAILAAVGFVVAFVTKSLPVGLTQAGGGLATGLVIWLPFYAFRTLGAGDVKSFAAASTFLGPRAAIQAALYTALYGGLMAFAFMLARSGLAATFIRVSHATQQPTLLRNVSSPNQRRMPYALAIAAGVLSAILWPGLIVT